MTTASPIPPRLPLRLISTELGAAMALFSDAQVKALRRRTVRFPAETDAADNGRELVAVALASSLEAYGAAELTPDVVAVAKMQVVIRSAAHYKSHGGPAGSRLARYAAELLNEVAEHHPDLLTAKAAWEMEDGARIGLVNFLVDKKLHPDVELLTPAAAALLAAGLQEETRRYVVSRVQMSGDTPLAAWACRLPAAGFDMLDAMLTQTAYARLLEEASKVADRNRPIAKCAQEILGGLVERIVRARVDSTAGAIRSTEDLAAGERASLVARIDSGWAMEHFSRKLVDDLQRARCSSTFIAAIPTLGKTLGLTEQQTARKFGESLVAGIKRHLSEHEFHADSIASKFTMRLQGRSGTLLADDDFMKLVTDFMRACDELTPDFLVDLRSSLKPKGRALPAELEARFAHELMRSQIHVRQAGATESAEEPVRSRPMRRV